MRGPGRYDVDKSTLAQPKGEFWLAMLRLIRLLVALSFIIVSEGQIPIFLLFVLFFFFLLP